MDAPADLEIVAGIDLESAVRALRARAQPDADDALQNLRRLRIFTQSLRILDEYQTERYRLPAEIDPREMRTVMSYNNYLSRIEENALAAIDESFPIWVDQMGEDILNLEGDTSSLIITPQGLQFSLEDFDYILQEITDFPVEKSLLWFCKLLDADVDQGTYWEAAEHFGWPMDRLPKTMTSTRRMTGVDGVKLLRMLNDGGLHEVATLFHVVWGDTDNPFFDMSEEQCYTEAGPYTLENVRRMHIAWDDAGMIRQHLAACEALREMPGIYERILDIWDRCIIYERKRKKKPQTLVEMWGGEMYENRPPRVIDPFYGPLDGQDDEDDDE